MSTELSRTRTEAEFPHPCCQCGFCCLAETCKIGQAVFNIDKDTLCPALRYKKDMAYCILAELSAEVRKDLCIGTGCSIKALAFKGGVSFDFASLPTNEKRKLVGQLMASMAKAELEG